MMHPRKQKAIMMLDELLEQVTHLTPTNLRNLHAIRETDGSLYVLELSRSFVSVEELRANINAILDATLPDEVLPVAAPERWKVLIEPDVDFIRREGMPRLAAGGGFLGVSIHGKVECQ